MRGGESAERTGEYMRRRVDRENKKLVRRSQQRE
jgi:hypothetical protein